MKKNIVFLFMCLLLTIFQPQAQALKEQDKKALLRILPYVIELGVVAGGITTLLVGYYGKKSCHQKIELLQNIERYCKENNLDPSVLFSEKILLFAQQQQQTKLLQQILHNRDTPTTLSRKELANKMLMYFGGTVVGLGVLAIVATALLQLATRNKALERHQKKKKKQEEKVAKIIKKHEINKYTQALEKVQKEEAALNTMGKEIVDRLTIQSLKDPEKKNKLKKATDRFLKSLGKKQDLTFKTTRLTPGMLRAITESALRRHRNELSQTLRDSFQKNVIGEIQSIVDDAEKKPLEHFNKNICSSITERMWAVHSPLISQKHTLKGELKKLL